jgi:hypothetical protein
LVTEAEPVAQLGYQQIFALVLEQLKVKPESQYAELVDAVVASAMLKGLLPHSEARGFGYRTSSHGPEAELVRQAYWDCVVKGLIVPGMNDSNPGWPWFRVTAQGRPSIEAGSPQPYDRDGFIQHFRKAVPGADPIVDGYLVEAVISFNAGCYRAAAVMLGVASEQIVLVLIEAFTKALQDGGKKSVFEKELRAWQILTRFQALKTRLDLMVTAKKLPDEHAETVQTVFGGVFDLLRQYRNAGGHPNVPGDVSADVVFINLRMFIEYARRTKALTEYFAANDADW